MAVAFSLCCWLEDMGVATFYYYCSKAKTFKWYAQLTRVFSPTLEIGLDIRCKIEMWNTSTKKGYKLQRLPMRRSPWRRGLLLAPVSTLGVLDTQMSALSVITTNKQHYLNLKAFVISMWGKICILISFRMLAIGVRVKIVQWMGGFLLQSARCSFSRMRGKGL